MVPPLQAPSVANLTTPWPAVTEGIFNTGDAIFQVVSWSGMLGFDDDREFTVQIDPNRQPRFTLLRPPATITVISGGAWWDVDQPIVQAGTATNVRVPAVDLDPMVPFSELPAVPVFPLDDYTDWLFGQSPETRDPGHQLRFVNIRRMRWIRARNIRVTRGLSR